MGHLGVLAAGGESAALGAALDELTRLATGFTDPPSQHLPILSLLTSSRCMGTSPALPNRQSNHGSRAEHEWIVGPNIFVLRRHHFDDTSPHRQIPQAVAYWSSLPSLAGEPCLELAAVMERVQVVPIGSHLTVIDEARQARELYCSVTET